MKIGIDIDGVLINGDYILDCVSKFCYDCRYNRDLNCKNMIRVFSWYDIYRKIKGLNE